MLAHLDRSKLDASKASSSPAKARELLATDYQFPVAWTKTYGKGRVYTTMLGHTWLNEDNPNFRCREFQVLIARGVEWAATGRVTTPVR